MMRKKEKLLILLFAIFVPSVKGECLPRNFGLGSVVCVDDVHHCDLPGPLTPAPAGHFLQVTSDKAGQRWNTTIVKWNEGEQDDGSGTSAAVVLSVDRTQQFQSILGFGGAFTDSAAFNIHSLPEPLQDCIVKSYFGSSGIHYTMGRVPIGGTDFSTRPYTYDDLKEDEDPDESLKKFALQPEDLEHKVPLIRAALAASPAPLRLVASPWSAPAWMKTNGRLDGKGKLQSKYWDVWGRYLVRFLQEYAARGVKIWAMTAQNEPSDGLISGCPINAMGWTVEEQTQWVGHVLGPALRDAGYGQTKIFVLDDNRVALPYWLDVVLANNVTRPFVDGVAVHWYIDFLVPVSVLDLTHQKYPNIPILNTEACTGQWPWQPLKVELGSWQRAQYYLDDMLETLNHWNVGWIDWSLALDIKGGPSWPKNFVDAPIIVNASAGEAFKQPMFYAIGHVSAFVPPDSVRVHTDIATSRAPVSLAKAFARAPVCDSANSACSGALRTAAFLRPDGRIAVVILNKRRAAVDMEVREGVRRGSMQLPPYSITTLLW